MYREAPIKNTMFDYVEFTRILKHGAKDLEDQWIARAKLPELSGIAAGKTSLASGVFQSAS